jgi:hypothetical protein
VRGDAVKSVFEHALFSEEGWPSIPKEPPQPEDVAPLPRNPMSEDARPASSSNLPDALNKKSPGDPYSRGSWRVEASPPGTTLLATNVPERARYALTEAVRSRR